jgi:hypothetical protein
VTFDLKKLLVDVFDPQPEEIVVVACDLPTAVSPDQNLWWDRREMACEWREAFAELGEERRFMILPLLTYAATGANGAELPRDAQLGSTKVSLAETLRGCTLAAFLTQFSATAPLDIFCRSKEDFRAASMPGLERRMENTSLSADYREVAQRCRILAEALREAQGLRVRFSTGHSCYFDLRFRNAEVDDGFLPRFKPGDRIINLPSGETFIVPYEGEKPGIVSQTEGILPIRGGGELVLLEVGANRITQVVGSGPEAEHLRAMFTADPARANIAEVAFGCNDWAQVTGNVLEDEKAGFHWAFGRSDHLGGTVGVNAFSRPDMVVHQDIVYAKGNPIQVVDASVIGSQTETPVISNGVYALF